MKPCLHPGCPALVRKGRCPAHARQYDAARASERRLEKRERWTHRGWKTLVLNRDPLCRGCERQPSTDADHIVALRLGGSWSLENGEGLCHACHAFKTATEQRDAFFGLRLAEDGRAIGQPAPHGWRR